MRLKENKNTSPLRTFFASYIHINFTAVWKWNEIKYHGDAYRNILSRYTYHLGDLIPFASIRPARSISINLAL